MKIILDLKDAQTPLEAQERLQSALNFPEYYGKNLDACYDMLTTWEHPAEFSLKLPKDGDMGAYGKRLQNVFEDAAAANSRIKLK